MPRNDVVMCLYADGMTNDKRSRECDQYIGVEMTRRHSATHRNIVEGAASFTPNIGDKEGRTRHSHTHTKKTDSIGGHSIDAGIEEECSDYCHLSRFDRPVRACSSHRTTCIVVKHWSSVHSRPVREYCQGGQCGHLQGMGQPGSSGVVAGRWMRRGVTPMSFLVARRMGRVGGRSHDARRATGRGAPPLLTTISAAVTGTTRPP